VKLENRELSFHSIPSGTDIINELFSDGYSAVFTGPGAGTRYSEFTGENLAVSIQRMSFNTGEFNESF
jgi:hypothetical protein